MGLIIKECTKQRSHFLVYLKKGRKWKSLGELWTFIEILGLLKEHRKCTTAIIQTLKLTTPHLGVFLEGLGRNRNKWYEHEFKPLLQKKQLV